MFNFSGQDDGEATRVIKRLEFVCDELHSDCCCSSAKAEAVAKAVADVAAKTAATDEEVMAAVQVRAGGEGEGGGTG